MARLAIQGKFSTALRSGACAPLTASVRREPGGPWQQGVPSGRPRPAARHDRLWPDTATTRKSDVIRRSVPGIHSPPGPRSRCGVKDLRVDVCCMSPSNLWQDEANKIQSLTGSQTGGDRRLHVAPSNPSMARCPGRRRSRHRSPQGLPQLCHLPPCVTTTSSHFYSGPRRECVCVKTRCHRHIATTLLLPMREDGWPRELEQCSAFSAICSDERTN